ncbi:MAG: CocE/NonD family hydrolase [Pseudomonadota bacterium]
MDHVATRTAFARKVREIENLWIPMSDGVRLAARIWLPEDAEADPVPAILEYLPYRKRDGTVERDHLTHPYFAGHGYAGVRVDMRGTGDSEGVCKGEYLVQEQDDALAVIAWLAEQPWCSGAVGMIGISWGGFNGLQIAARQPPALKAVVSLCSTDDRYADDIHFMGGTILTDKLTWGATAFAIAHTPPDPAIVGDGWREQWLQRLEGNGLWLLDWFRHQRRDGFWQHGSICEDFSAVKVPVYAVGGWADGYTNAVFRLVENLPGAKGLVGPWAHKYPHFAKPGPQIGFLQECLRWWDQHLKGIDTGITKEPALRAWINHPAPPAPFAETLPGHWVAESAWPGPGVAERPFALAPGALVDGPAEPTPMAIKSPETVGMAAASWCAYGLVADGSLDQRAEAGGSLVFETAPLAEPVEILGFPVLDLALVSDKPVANVAAVLSAVASDGAATRVSFGVLNLTHRESHAEPTPLPVGEPIQATVQLNACGHRFGAGEKIRLALSTAYWPVIWPAPESPTLTTSAGESVLRLPVRAPVASDAALPAFGPAEGAAPLEAAVLRGASYNRTVTTDQVTGETVFERRQDDGTVLHKHTGIAVSFLNVDRYTISSDDPATARGTCRWVKAYERGDWRAVVEVEARVEALRDVFRLTANLVARDADGVVFEKDWAEDIPRDLV